MELKEYYNKVVAPTDMKWINPRHIVSVELDEEMYWMNLIVKTSDGRTHQIRSFMINRDNVHVKNGRSNAEAAYKKYTNELRGR